MTVLHAELAHFDAPAPNWRRLALIGFAALALAVAGGGLIGERWLSSTFTTEEMHGALLAAVLLAFVITMALPFVPGIELGLCLMLLLGDEGIAIVYAATQVSLAMSFALGRWVPAPRLGAALRWLGLDRADRLLRAMDAVPPAERAAFLARRAPGRWSRLLGRHFSLALAVVLNLPGNAVLGGAGGIGMIAGMSRAIPLARFVLVMAAATTPVPLFLLLR